MTEETELDDLLAAELVLGLLDDEDRKAALARVEVDPRFAAVFARWQAHAATLLSQAEGTPSDAVWKSIAARIPANDTRRRSLRFWEFTAAAGLIAGLAASVTLISRESVPSQRGLAFQPTPIALLTGEGGLAMAIAYDPAARTLTITPHSLFSKGHSAELWVIPRSGKPMSLGLIAANGVQRTKAPSLAASAIGAGATLAVSIEPLGGSPTGVPTGPVILSGQIISA